MPLSQRSAVHRVAQRRSRRSRRRSHRRASRSLARSPAPGTKKRSRRPRSMPTGRPSRPQGGTASSTRTCERLSRTKDHVIPQAFISSPQPPNLPTWPACKRCNDLVSAAEDRLRAVIASAPSRHPQERLENIADQASRSTPPVRPDRIALRTNNSGEATLAGLVDSNRLY
jgi:hypothetical protein